MNYLSLFALQVLVITPLAVHAQTIVVLDTLSGGVDTTSGSRVAGPGASGGYFGRAITFTAPTSDYRISSADFEFKVNEFAGDGQAFLATIRVNDGGKPGSVVTSEDFSGSYFDASVHVDFTNSSSLVSGASYWFGVEPVAAPYSGIWYSPSGLASRLQAYSTGSTWTAYTSQYGGAALITAAAIPEPATVGLIGGVVSMLVLVYLKRSRRQA